MLLHRLLRQQTTLPIHYQPHPHRHLQPSHCIVYPPQTIIHSLRYRQEIRMLTVKNQ